MPVRSPYADGLDTIPKRSHDTLILGSRTRWWEYGTEVDDGLPSVVVVHGFRGDHHGLEPIIAHLPHTHVIAPDLPGFGQSTPMTDARHDIPGYVAWLLAFVEEFRKPVVILGHSFGSIIVAAALASGLTVPAAILVNPIGAPALSGPRGVLTRLAVLYYRVAARLPERLGFALLRNRVIVRIMSMAMVTTPDRALRRWVHEEHDRYFSVFSDRQVVLEAFEASVTHHVGEYADHIAIPAMLVAATDDDITPIDAQHRLAARITGCRLNVIDDVGHLIHYEKPAEAAAFITDFLAEVSAR